jgi:AcrR family transcriptional regulator
MPARRTPTRAKATSASKAKPKTNGKRNGSANPGDESTPAKVVDAAIACILEEGFYRASSNEIARRAEVTWGVIQYHFGTREALLLGVLQRAAAELQRELTETQIVGETIAARIDELSAFVWRYYARPEFLAYMQVMLNLSHDPTTEVQTKEAMEENQLLVSQSLPRLCRDVIGNALADDDPDKMKLAMFVFAALRGMAIDQGHVAALPTSRANPAGHDEERRLLVASLATHVEAASNGKSRGILSRRR